jgi:outer membrane protein assembly factor BamE (lipoprotein component of BamABCDE complex)
LKLISLIATLTILAGCATAHKINGISLGMTKQEVIETLGQPVSTSATTGVEYLNYRFSETDDHAFNGVTTPYFVRIVGGKVESYGRLGDFDSTRNNSTINLNVNSK